MTELTGIQEGATMREHAREKICQLQIQNESLVKRLWIHDHDGYLDAKLSIDSGVCGHTSFRKEMFADSCHSAAQNLVTERPAARPMAMQRMCSQR